MESMEAQKKPGIMARLRNRKGFSLVEMAIVLVIIGIIIGAIVKGQDLIANSRAKQVVAAVSTWRNLSLAFLDRNGRLPGDQTKLGYINKADAGETATAEIVKTMQSYPANPINIGGENFYVYFGNVTGIPTVPAIRSAIYICGILDCTAALNKDQVEIIKTIDTSFDNAADAGNGQIRALVAAPTASLVNTLVATSNPVVYEGFITASGADSVKILNAAIPAGGALVPWDITHFGAVWLFDKQF